MTEPTDIQVPPGTIAVTTHGSVKAETADNLINLLRRAERLGLRSLDHGFIFNSLVDKARNEACRQMLAHKRGTPEQKEWIWFIDGDMIFEPTLLDHMLKAAFNDCPWADVIGGYCQLRHHPFLPTIDLGSGTWESIDPNQGPLEVIRTGAACLLVKRKVLERMADPWFETRTQPKPLEILTEMDNYARCKFDGRNPFAAHKEWDQLLRCAVDERGAGDKSVGEDSCFADKARALGFRICVQTDAVMGHLTSKAVVYEDHRQALKDGQRKQRHLVGVLA